MLIMVNKVSKSISKYLISETFLYHLAMVVNIFENNLSPITQQCFLCSRKLLKIVFERTLIFCISKSNVSQSFYQKLYSDKFSWENFFQFLRILRKFAKIYEARIYWISDSQKVTSKNKKFLISSIVIIFLLFRQLTVKFNGTKKNWMAFTRLFARILSSSQGN